MSEHYEPICVDRILVSLDSSTHSFAALQAAVMLARHFNAELKGVFIEDDMLLNIAQMPFRQEVGEYTAIVREISSDGLTRGIFVQSRWVIQSFNKLINQTDLTTDFAVLRGNVIEMIDKESRNCDLIIIGKSGTSTFGRHRLGSTAKALIKIHEKPLLLVEEKNQLGNPLIVLYENSPLGKISLETGKALLDPEETMLILLNEDDPEFFSKEKVELDQWAARHKVNISIQPFKTHRFTSFLQMIDGLKTGLFVLPHDDKSQHQGIAKLCLKEMHLPILLIRTANQQ